MSLKDELDLAEARLNQNEYDRVSLIKVGQELSSKVDDIKQQIADSEVTKLRHGDYGFDTEGRPCMSVKLSLGQGMKDVGRDYVWDKSHFKGGSHVVKVLGNIFDDLNKKK
jgi:hypothetical protein